MNNMDELNAIIESSINGQISQARRQASDVTLDDFAKFCLMDLGLSNEDTLHHICRIYTHSTPTNEA